MGGGGNEDILNLSSVSGIAIAGVTTWSMKGTATLWRFGLLLTLLLSQVLF